MRQKSPLLFISLCFASSCRTTSPAPPVSQSPPSIAADRTPLGALAEEARRADLSLRVSRGDELLLERYSASVDRHPVLVLGPVLMHLAARNNLPESGVDDRDEYLLGRAHLWILDYANRPNDAMDLYERGVFGPLEIAPKERRGTDLSLAAAERVARVFVDRGVHNGTRILPERFVAQVTTGEKKLLWEPIREGELAVITRPIFDSWRAVPSIDRSLFPALEPLVDMPIPIDDLGRVLDEKLGKRSDAFRNDVMKARKQLFERRWQSNIGFSAFGPTDAVVVLTRSKLIAVYATPRYAYMSQRSLLPFLRALE